MPTFTTPTASEILARETYGHLWNGVDLETFGTLYMRAGSPRDHVDETTLAAARGGDAGAQETVVRRLFVGLPFERILRPLGPKDPAAAENARLDWVPQAGQRLVRELWGVTAEVLEAEDGAVAATTPTT